MKGEYIKSLIGLLFLVAAVFLITYGIVDREIVTVFNKAVNICMECIGIG
ncbi:MAG: CD1871A family CXXC motif-containing protein [Eubacteriales bacterium]|nr:CD1871A family CXXC motif-containing protein [Eubacteriales bacterium]